MVNVRTIVDVVRGEGLASTIRRANERIGSAVRDVVLRARRGPWDAPILNLSSTSVAPRTGGVAIQLMARLRAERTLRTVALLHPGGLEVAGLRRVAGIAEALAITGAKTVHLEGTSEVPLAELLRLHESGVTLVVSVHDFSLWDEPLAGALLDAATAVIFPSAFLRDQYRQRFDVQGEVIEPAVPGADRGVFTAGVRRAVAYAGSVKPHKGGHLLPDLARGTPLHVFGGGDVHLLRELRQVPNAVIHGYYRSGALPSLLARHGVGLVVLPSIAPESYSLVLSEAWLGGAAVVAFDHGAPAERIRRDGGGWLVPPESGTAGLLEIIERWKSGELAASIPPVAASPIVAARTHVELYRRLVSLY